MFTPSILDMAHEAFISMDAAGRILEWNRAAELTFGYARSEAVGRQLADTIIPERLRDAHRAGLARYLSTGESVILDARTELTALHRDGHEFPIEATISCLNPVPNGGRRDGATFHAFAHDISDRKLTEQVLRAMQAVTQAMARADTAHLALSALLAELGQNMDWDVGAYWMVERDGTLDMAARWAAPRIDASEFVKAGGRWRLAPGTGLPGEAVRRGAAVWLRELSPDSGSPGAQPAALTGLPSAICVPVPRDLRIVGVVEFFCSALRVSDAAIAGALATVGSQVGELLGIVEDRAALMKSLETLALTDQLTGLPNRRAWEEGLDRELSRAAREAHPVCVAVIDLDEFKRYNDDRGHLAGDALLTATAIAWRKELRGADLLARYGGEEFAAVIPAWPLETALAIVERLREATPAGQTCSAGVARWDGSESALELFGRADAALYAAKQSGRNRTVSAD
ncbi:MAG TPA: diguanylate cyclase [Solirubrobacteraceae bacterium]|nr:diguanylate cyclase [Solirubrobacteraceae bacterium]